MADGNGETRTTLGIGGGSYGLVALGVGLAAHTWGTTFIGAVIRGIFWPATVGYWLAQALRALSG
jgi:hypothetical protein